MADSCSWSNKRIEHQINWRTFTLPHAEKYLFQIQRVSTALFYFLLLAKTPQNCFPFVVPLILQNYISPPINTFCKHNLFDFPFSLHFNLGSISCPVSFYRAKHQLFTHLYTVVEINHQYGGEKTCFNLYDLRNDKYRALVPATFSLNNIQQIQWEFTSPPPLCQGRSISAIYYEQITCQLP
jgi:hypothetical protein